MAKAPATPSAIPEDRAFQERFWRVERFAWATFAVIICLAAAGLFGSGGPLASASRTFEQATVRYPAIARWRAAEEFTVLLPGSGERSVALSPGFVDAFEIEDIHPAATRSSASANGHMLTFATGDGPARIDFTITPRRPGLATYSVTIGEGAAIDLSTFIWP